MRVAVKPIKVLLVDASEPFQSGIIDFLSGRKDYAIVGTAGDCEIALQMIDRLKPDLVLMDAVLPGSSGFETARKIKQRENAPKIIILTFHDSQAARLEAWAAGADQFVAKADLADELLPAVRALFSGPEKTKSDSPPKGILTPNSGNP